jgi:hypothetical protein
VTRILAIDPGTQGMGIADGIVGETPTLSAIKFRADGDDDHMDILGRAGRWMWMRVSLQYPDVLAIERPVPPHAARGFTNANTTELTIGLYGGLVMIAKAARIKIMPAHIATWRKAVLGKGNLKGDVAKRQMMAMCRRMKLDPPDHNAAEAAGIWMWAAGTNQEALLRKVA